MSDTKNMRELINRAGALAHDAFGDVILDALCETAHLLDKRPYQEAVSPNAMVAERPIPMRLVCPDCGKLHIDEGEFATKPHYTHACQECGCVWRPAVVNTVGVRFLPGFKNDSVKP